MINLRKILFFCLLSTIAYSQVGINTDYPTGSLLIDGGKDNTSTAPSSASQSNDVKVDNNGFLGIGINSPTTYIDIKSQPNMGFRLKDGTEGDYYRLKTNSLGNATWKKRASVIVSVNDVTFSGQIFTNTINYVGRYLILKPGKWLIRTNLTLATNSEATPSDGFYAKFAWAEKNSDNTYFLTPDATFGVIIGGLYNLKYGLAKGSTIIENTSSSSKTYYLVTNGAELAGNGTYNPNAKWFGLGGWGETSIMAFPSE